MTTTANLSFPLGDEWTIDVTCDDAISTLSGATVEWRMATDSELKMKLVVGQGITVTDAAAKKFRITVTDARQTTANITEGLYLHEAFVSLPAEGGSIQMSGTLEARDSLKIKFPGV